MIGSIYFYNPISSILDSFTLWNINGLNVMTCQSDKFGAIYLTSDLVNLIYNDNRILFAISDYLIEHRQELKKEFELRKEEKFSKSNSSISILDLMPIPLVSFSADNRTELEDAIDITSLVPRYSMSNDIRIKKILKNLSILQNGMLLNINDIYNYRYILYCNDSEQPYEVLAALVSQGYLAHVESAIGKYVITDKGKKHLEEFSAPFSGRGFIAMRFSAEESEIKADLASIRDSFKTAISAAGYEPVVIDELRHNNLIPLEIINQIKGSDFLVLDLTHQNFGAVYEAGIATGAGKEVIHCIRRKEFNNKETRPHFDYVQRNMVMWDTYDELVLNLKDQIIGTVKSK